MNVETPEASVDVTANVPSEANHPGDMADEGPDIGDGADSDEYLVCM